MLSLNRKGDLTIDYVIVMVILLVLLIVLVLYMGVLKGSSANILEKIMEFFTGS